MKQTDSALSRELRESIIFAEKKKKIKNMLKIKMSSKCILIVKRSKIIKLIVKRSKIKNDCCRER